MSKILRRPMFRGGPVSSYGNGIATGLADGGRVGYDVGGPIYQSGYSAAPGTGITCLLYTSPSPRDRTRSRMPSSA